MISYQVTLAIWNRLQQINVNYISHFGIKAVDALLPKQR